MTMKTRKMNALVVMSSKKSSLKPQLATTDGDVGNVGDGFRSFRLNIITLGECRKTFH
jgi:hypothetical protein